MNVWMPPRVAENWKHCDGFAWLGQSLRYCDDCGRPYWEHTHRKTGWPDAGPFDSRPPKLVPIVPAHAARVKEQYS